MEHYRVGSNEDLAAPLSVLSSSVEQQTYVAHGWMRPVSDTDYSSTKVLPFFHIHLKGRFQTSI